MAHVAKVKSAGVAPMVGHYAREAEARGYGREGIDPARTGLNYTVGFGKESEPSAVGFGKESEPSALAGAVRRRVAEARESHEKASGRALRKDANVLMDWVVTRPQDCPEGLTEVFFQAVVAFVQERYGRENVPGGFVHMDETTPHVHVPVIPVRDGKLVASKVVTRQDLRTFHADLGRAVDAALGVHVSVELDESQKGARQLSHLGQDEYRAAKAELARVQAEVDAAKERLERLRREEEGLEAEVAGLEPAAESVAESARYLAEHRGDGERVAVLEGEVEQLKGELERVDGRASACRAAAERAEAERAASRERVAGMAGLRERIERGCRDLEQRVGVLAVEFRRVVGGVVWNVTEGARDVLRSLGVDARAERPGLDWMLGEARAAADAYNRRNRGRDEPSRGWGMSR